MDLHNSLLTGISASRLAQFIQSLLYIDTQVIFFLKKCVNLISFLYTNPFMVPCYLYDNQTPEHVNSMITSIKVLRSLLSLIFSRFYPNKTNYSFSNVSSYVMPLCLCNRIALPYFTLVISLLYYSLTCTAIIWVYIYLF